MLDGFLLLVIKPITFPERLAFAKYLAPATTVAGEVDQLLLFLEHAARSHHPPTAAFSDNQFTACGLVMDLSHRRLSHRVL